MKERIEGARPMMDLMAKKIFSNTKITAQFIRDIFDLPVEQVKILESTQIHEFYLDEFPFSTHIDVLAELDDHTQIIIEIQVALQIDFIKHLCLYLCEQVSKNMNMHKKDGTQTYHLAKEMIPVYAIAITQERYFEDDRMYHSFSLRDDEFYEELKVYFKGIKEKRNLIRMAFLELDKYDPTKIKHYRKVRWIEFFGNKPYTQNPEAILETADMIMNRTGWTEEERTMYDDRTRKLDGYYAHLEYVAEEKELARMEGISEGAITTIVSLIKDGILTVESGAKRLNMSESELAAYLS
jgi:hypothetical protein